MRTEKNVFVVPGHHGGMDSYLRLSTGNPEDELMDGRAASGPHALHLAR